MPDFAEVQQRPSSLECWQGQAFAMKTAHRHDDLELNLVTGAPLTYLFGGTVVEIAPGQAALFWASIPHRLMDCPGNWEAHVRWLHVPLASVLGWGLSASAISALLGGTPLVAPQADRPDTETFRRWTADLESGEPELREITLLEIQAGVRRLLRGAIEPEHDPNAGGPVGYVAKMARYVADSFHREITAADVAAACHLHPNYAMTLFRRVLGVTLHGYVRQRRVAEAQRLLVTTDTPAGQIAQLTGFGSQSAFYATFTRSCGMPPAAYRRPYRITR